MNWRDIGENQPRGHSYKETWEQLVKRIMMVDELVQEQREEISRLKCKLNDARSKRYIKWQ